MGAEWQVVGTSALALTSSDIAVDNRCSLTTHDPPVNQFTPISFSSATRWKVPCKQAPSLFSYTPHSPEHTAGLINPHCIEVLARLEKGRRWGVLGAGLCCLPLSLLQGIQDLLQVHAVGNPAPVPPSRKESK